MRIAVHDSQKNTAKKGEAQRRWLTVREGLWFCIKRKAAHTVRDPLLVGYVPARCRMPRTSNLDSVDCIITLQH